MVIIFIVIGHSRLIWSTHYILSNEFRQKYIEKINSTETDRKRAAG